MSEVFSGSIPVLIPELQSISESTVQDVTAEISNCLPEGLQPGQSVRFLKITVQSSGKIIFKETYGKVVKVEDSHVEITDLLGDVVVCSIHNVKALINQELDLSDLSMLSAV